MDIELAPVDVVSDAIVALSLQQYLSPVYHLNNPATMEWKNLKLTEQPAMCKFAEMEGINHV